MPKGIYLRTLRTIEHQENQRKAVIKALKGKKWSERRKGVLSISRMGKLNPSYKEGKYIDDTCRKNARKIMEKHLGRKLKREEHVHHLDGNCKNNDIKNLYLFPSIGKHISYHIKLKKFVNEELLKIGFRYNFRSNIINRKEV